MLFMMPKFRKKGLLSLLLLLFLFSCSAAPTKITQAAESPSPSETADLIVETHAVFLPTIATPPGKFFGIYLPRYWNQENVALYMPVADGAAGKKHSSVGWFIDLEDDAFRIPVTALMKNNLYRQLEELWRAGYVSFINLSTDATAAQILNGERDMEIGYAAEFYKTWVDAGNGRIAMIGPLQEMNGDWTSYGKNSTSAEIKAAYRYIVDKFYQKGVRRDQVWWVFAPNGWNSPDQPERMFENYYPGDDVVDFVGFSSYNYGFCPDLVNGGNWAGRWEGYAEIFEPYINRMKAMAPSKPVIIAETSTTSYIASGISDEAAKDQWLVENYRLLAANSAVVGVYYFNFTNFDGVSCDSGVVMDDVSSAGYKEAIANNKALDYLSARDIAYYVK